MSHITVTLTNLTLPLPDDKVIIDLKDYQQFLENERVGKYLTLAQVLKDLSVSRPWLMEHVLLNPNYRAKIDIDQNPEGFVKYPANKGGKYLFLASKTRHFFEDNFTALLAS